MRRQYGPPVLTVEDVWDSSVGISVEQPPVGLNGRPQRWDIAVYDGRRLIQTFTVPCASLVEHVRIDRGLEGTAEVTVSVRGAGDEGVGVEATVKQRLLPPPTLRQETILPDALQLHWYFPDWHSPFEGLVSKFEIALSSGASAGVGGGSGGEAVSQEFLCSFSPEADCLQGNALVRLAPHMLRDASNFAVYGRVRCYGARAAAWGQWSPTTRLMCLTPLSVELRNVTSQSMVFVWGRNASEAATAHPSVQDEDVAVDRMEVVAWPARLRSAPRLRNGPHSSPPSSGVAPDRDENADTPTEEGEAFVPPRAVSQGQTRAYGANLSLLEGLEPNTVYNVCCRWQHMCGGGWHREFFRVATRAEPEIVAVPTVGHTFVDLHWAAKGGSEVGLTADLTEYVDDTFEVGGDPSPPFRIVGGGPANACVAQGRGGGQSAVALSAGRDLHRIIVSEGARHIKTVDAPHNSRQRVQSRRIGGLEGGATVRLRIKTASHFEVDGVDHWSWGRESEVVVVTMVSPLRVVPQERGPNFIVLSLRCDPSEPVRVLRRGALFAEEAPALRPRYVTPLRGVYALEPVGEGDVDIATFPNDGSTSWGYEGDGGEEVATAVKVRLDAPVRVQLIELKPNWTYRFSINVTDVEDRRWGRTSSAFVTSAEDLLNVRPYVTAGPEQALRIDQAFHDKALRAASDLAIRYPVVVGEQRQEELAATTAMLPSRLTSIALKAHVSALGSDHCVLHWEAFAIADGRGGEASVLHHADVAEHQAKAFNTAPYALYEYRLKAFVCMAESVRLASQRERGVAEVSKDLYFRSAVRQAKLLGLEEGYRYRIALSYYNVVAQKWSPWSEPVCLMPADRLVTNVARLSGTCAAFRWRRLAVPPIDRPPSQAIAPIKYEVLVVRHGSNEGASVTTFCAQPEHTVTDLPSGVLSVTARPWFDADSCGPFAAPAYVSVAPLRLTAESITQSTASLWWTLPPVVPARGAKGRVVINVTGSNGSRTVIDVGPLDTRYVLKNLAPSTAYTVSAAQLVEAEGPAGAHVYDAVDPSSFVTLGPLVVTVAEIGEDFALLSWPRRSLLDSDISRGGDGDANASAAIGRSGAVADESLVSVASPLRTAPAPSPASEGEGARLPAESSSSNAPLFPHTSATTETSSPERPPLQQQRSALRQRFLASASLQERYELIVEDCEFGHTVRTIVPCSRGGLASAFYKVSGLMPGGAYRARVRIDSEAAFFSEDVLFRTADPLVARLDRLADSANNVGTISILHPLRPAEAAEGEGPQMVPVRVATEVRIEEVPKAPARHLTGSRAAAALAKVRRAFVRRLVLPPTTHVATVAGLPPVGTVLTISARQQAATVGGEDWLPWVYSTVTV